MELVLLFHSFSFLFNPLLSYAVYLTKSTLKFESKFEVQKVKKNLIDRLYSKNYILMQI